MTQPGATALVKSLTLSPPSISLLNSAIVEDETDERWVNGLRYIGESPSTGEVFNLCGSFTKNVAAASTPLTGTPYGVVAQDTCSTIGFRTRDFQARATRQLLAVESRVIAHELWTNSLGLNPALADPLDVVVTGTTSPESLLYAIGTIEQAFYAVSSQRAMIHMRPNILEAIQSLTGSALRREGNVYFTAMDSVISADRGYPGTGPTGQAVSTTQEWIYLTTMVQIRHSPVMVVPTGISEAVLRTQNEVTFFAERAVSAIWDYNTPTFALNVKRNG